MRLSFSLLWFDDSVDYLDSIKNNLGSLEAEIHSWGFFPDIRFVETPEKFREHSPYATFDMIVVDQNLEGYPDGQEFIAELRKNAIYTEVIFYSARSVRDLWKSIHEKQLEGVFVSNRDDVIPKIIRIGSQSIRKVLDLENMRGIIMAEVGELDLLLKGIIAAGMPTLEESQQKKIFSKFYDAEIENNGKHKEALESFIKNPQIEDMITLCNSYKLWCNFNRLKKEHKVLKTWKTLSSYDADILQPRNFLAHGKPEQDGAGGYLFTHRGKRYPFDDDISRRLRQTILSYKDEFSRIINSFSGT